MQNIIQHQYFIPVNVKEEIFDSTTVDEEVNCNYLLYKCIRTKFFYVFELVGCNRKCVRDEFKRIVVFSANNYTINDYLLINKIDLFQNTFKLETNEYPLNNYFGYTAISEIEFVNS